MKHSFFKTKIIIALLFLTISCSENNKEVYTPTLPPITQTGENTFACYVDGQLLVPRDGIGSINGINAKKGMSISEYSPTPNRVEYYDLDVIHGKSKGDDGPKSLSFFIYDIHQLGKGNYPIKQGNPNSQHINDDDKAINIWLSIVQDSKAKIYYSIEDSGTLNITRYDSRIISGTFSCKAVNKDDPTDIIEITEGRFDINLNTLNNTEFP